MLSLFWGFRLTIWNVKLTREHIISNIKNSFRLTIWNVKLDSKYKLKKFLSFRLTIWNVKIFDAMKKFTTKLVLD